MLLDMQVKDEDAQRQLKALLEGNARADVSRGEQQRLLDRARADLGQYQLQLEAAELKLSRAQVRVCWQCYLYCYCYCAGSAWSL